MSMWHAAGAVLWMPPSKPLQAWPQIMKYFFTIPLYDETLMGRLEQHLSVLSSHLVDPRHQTEQEKEKTFNHICDVVECCVYVKTERPRRLKEAFAMGSHPRLGAGSWASTVVPDLMPRMLAGH